MNKSFSGVLSKLSTFIFFAYLDPIFNHCLFIHSIDIYKDARGCSPLVFSSGDISFSKRNCLNKLELWDVCEGKTQGSVGPNLVGPLSHQGSPIPVHVCCAQSSVLSNSLQPHGLWPTRLLCPWDYPGKNTGVGCHFLFQRIFPTQGSNLCPTWQVDSLPLSHLGNSVFDYFYMT